MDPTTPFIAQPADDPEKTVAQFFDAVSRRNGPSLSSADPDALVAAIRADRGGAGDGPDRTTRTVLGRLKPPGSPGSV